MVSREQVDADLLPTDHSLNGILDMTFGSC
jgi:hypothetical protein